VAQLADVVVAEQLGGVVVAEPVRLVRRGYYTVAALAAGYPAACLCLQVLMVLPVARAPSAAPLRLVLPLPDSVVELYCVAALSSVVQLHCVAAPDRVAVPDCVAVLQGRAADSDNFAG
jgi:hypothetical protein